MFECDLLVVEWQADRGVAGLQRRFYPQSVDEAFQHLVTEALARSIRNRCVGLKACSYPPYGGKGRDMNNPDNKPSSDRPRFGGGIFLFLGLLIGSIVGIAMNEASIGMVAGFGIGGLLAILVWIFDRKRAEEGR
jgi:hypothetical protein